MSIDNPLMPAPLPFSRCPLVNFDSLYILRRKVLESVVIAMPQQYLPTDPSAYLFQPPIQVVVLGIEGEQVKLGVYANSFLQFQQGPPPDKPWLKRWHSERPNPYGENKLKD